MTSIISKATLICAASIFMVPVFRPPQAAAADTPAENLVKNSEFKERSADGTLPAWYEITGNARYRYLGDPRREVAGWGVTLQSGVRLNGSTDISGSVSQTVAGLDSKAGRWYRFSFRGLPQDNFAVADNDLRMKAAFLGNGGRTSYDAKAREIYSAVQQARQDLSVNGVRRTGGAAVWRNYTLDFRLPFPQVDEVRLSVEFGHGMPGTAAASGFYVTDFSLVQIPAPAGSGDETKPAGPENIQPQGTPLPLGGRWFYDANPGETAAPKLFNASNADRLLYRDAGWTTPFSGNMSAWLRAGDKDLSGNIVQQDRLIPDNVTVSFDATSMIIHTHGIPNHPTGKFPQQFPGNPSYIQEQNSTYYIPLEPKENPSHTVTTTDNSNHALPMGPIGIAVNGVVFFNPFDMGNRDATDLMDYCCGHPNQMNLYHYHKYPICVNSPWSDEGKAPSPLIGWAFDGFPIYGPYESAGVMAKDVQGAESLNGFNIHYDRDRGWHYHVTPGKFPYIIGGYWGTEDPRDSRRGPPGGGGPGRGSGGGQFNRWPPPFPPPGGGGFPPGPPPPP